LPASTNVTNVVPASADVPASSSPSPDATTAELQVHYS
jgi:hypothetical protein